MVGLSEHRGALRFDVLASIWTRFRGLLGTTTATGRPVALIPCQSIHTVGMRYCLDVALVSRDGLVVDARRHISPGNFVSHPHAYICLERPSVDSPWPRRGEWLALSIKNHMRRDG